MRVDAYPEIGYGHLKRCLVLAHYFREKGEDVSFCESGDSTAVEEIQNAGFDLHRIPKKLSFSGQLKQFELCDFENVDITVLDISYSSAVRDSQGLALYLKEITSKTFTVFIDSFGVQSLRENTLELICNILVSPYAGEEKSKQHVKYIELLGVDYYVLDTTYQDFSKKKISKDANRVLVTCGGSDPASISIKILNALNLITNRLLDIKVVVGSGFSLKLNEALLKISGESPHRVHLIRNLNSLSEEMSWCDIAVATSGLTKYELAATGTPAILVSIDQSHDAVNQYFICEKTAIDLGIVDDVSDIMLADAVYALLENENERRQQSWSGQKLVNGGGTKKLADDIIKYKNINLH